MKSVLAMISILILIANIVVMSGITLATPNIVKQIIEEFNKEFFSTISLFYKVLVNVMRVVYIVLAAIGVLLWAAGIEPYKGRKLIIGAIVLAIAVEYLSRITLPIH